MKLSFLTKPTFPKFNESFNESHFQPKIITFYYWFYWFWISSTTGLLVLNKFIEINTLIKRNLNFECEVKSHKVRLQAYCNKPLLKWSYLCICQSCDCMVMTSIVPGERWPLDTSPRAVPAADIWRKWMFEYLPKSGHYVPMTSLSLWKR